MCYECFDADKMAAKLKSAVEVCDGLDMVKMSLEELKSELMEEWMATEKTHFRIFKQAVPEFKMSSISWQVTSPLDNDKKAQIHVSFV